MIVRTLAGTEPISVLSASATPFTNGSDEQRRTIDVGTEAGLEFPSDVTAEIACHSRRPGWGPLGLLPHFPEIKVEATCEGGRIEFTNFLFPNVYNKIQVTTTSGKRRDEWAYTFDDGVGEDWWLTSVLQTIGPPIF